MAYEINKTDGTTLATLQDGTVDNTHTDIVLIGKNFSGFGEYINENFVKLLENFASQSQPPRPVQGQLWYDTSQKRLKIYSDAATGWKGANGTLIQDSEPLTYSSGDIWIDSKEKRMYFYVSSGKIPSSKSWDDSQGKTGVVTESILDFNNNTKTVLGLYVSGYLLGIYSADSFEIKKNDSGESTVTGFDSLSKGFNANPLFDSVFDAIVSKSKNLLSAAGDSFTADDFLKKNVTDGTIGKLSILNDEGLTIGQHEYIDMKVDGTEFILENTASNGNISIKTTNVAGSNTAIYIDATQNYVGIDTNTPARSLDIKGNATISGTFQLGRFSTAQRNGLNPEDGDMIYNTDLQRFQGYSNGNWEDLTRGPI